MSKHDFKYNLGDLLQDKMTSFEGIVEVICVWYNGCVRYGLRPKTLKDNMPQELWYLDEQLATLQEEHFVPVEVAEKSVGVGVGGGGRQEQTSY